MQYYGSHDIDVSDRCYLNAFKTQTIFQNVIFVIYSIAIVMQIHPLNKDGSRDPIKTMSENSSS